MRKFRNIVVAGCALTALVVSVSVSAEEPIAVQPATPPADVESVASSRIQVHFTLKPGAEPLTAIDLYYTTDNALTWTRAAAPTTLSSPLTFDAPGDGQYGLYLVFHTATVSTPAPRAGDRPHRWIRVDRSAPVLQLLSIRPDRRFDLNREVHLRWRAQDDNLSSRPVAIHFRTTQTKSFQPVAIDQPVEGTFRWTVPEDAFGRVEIRITGIDRAGNRGEYVDDRLQISNDKAELAARTSESEARLLREPAIESGDHAIDDPDNSQAADDGGSELTLSEPDAGEFEPNAGAAKEAKRQYDLATWHRLRGEMDVAISKYRAALDCRPDFTAARNDLAAALSLQGELEAAEREFAAVLESDARHLPALRGLAYVQARRRNYRSAHATLQKLLLLEPKDAEAWLNFGDVCLFMGDRPAARDAWNRAASLEVSPRDVRRRAEKRLDLYGPQSASLGAVDDATAAAR